VAVSVTEEQLGKLRVRASAEQARQLTQWAVSWPEQTWAVEGASGCWTFNPSSAPACGCWPRAARNKNDPNDARSVAIAALRSAGCRQVRADDHGGAEAVVQAEP
jgi:transposase